MDPPGRWLLQSFPGCISSSLMESQRKYTEEPVYFAASCFTHSKFQSASFSYNRYNHCRKVAFVPFPFPHHQATVLFTFLSLFIFPLLFAGFVGNVVVACVLNAITVICFLGTHEVSRELSNPYFAVPNDLPLNNYQAQLNEALVCMWAGFHPDSWRADDDNNTLASSSRRTLGTARNEVPLSESPGIIMLEEQTLEV